MSEIKLKPCPFCGGEAELLIVPGKMAKWEVRCMKCYANNGTFVSDHDAVEAWNKRAERHGQWVRLRGFFKCSACDSYYGGLSTYCPHCGAKMDEEESE